MIRKISEKRLSKGEKLCWNSTIKAKAYTLKKSPLRKVSRKSANLWEKAKKECLEHYGKRCFLCGAENCEIHIHHWQETRSQNPARKYDQTNLVPLCSKCHNHHGVDDRFYELRDKIKFKMGMQWMQDLYDKHKDSMLVYGNVNILERIKTKKGV